MLYTHLFNSFENLTNYYLISYVYTNKKESSIVFDFDKKKKKKRFR